MRTIRYGGDAYGMQSSLYVEFLHVADAVILVCSAHSKPSSVPNLILRTVYLL